MVAPTNALDAGAAARAGLGVTGHPPLINAACCGAELGHEGLPLASLQAGQSSTSVRERGTHAGLGVASHLTHSIVKVWLSEPARPQSADNMAQDLLKQSSSCAGASCGCSLTPYMLLCTAQCSLAVRPATCSAACRAAHLAGCVSRHHAGLSLTDHHHYIDDAHGMTGHTYWGLPPSG